MAVKRFNVVFRCIRRSRFTGRESTGGGSVFDEVYLAHVQDKKRRVHYKLMFKKKKEFKTPKVEALSPLELINLKVPGRETCPYLRRPDKIRLSVQYVSPVRLAAIVINFSYLFSFAILN